MSYICIMHGLPSDEHDCLYCGFCYETLTPEECSYDVDGKRVDVCIPCAQKEKEYGIHIVKRYHQLMAEGKTNDTS